MSRRYTNYQFALLAFSLLAAGVIFLPTVQGASTGNEVFKDGKNDVISDLKKGPLSRLQDLYDLGGEKAEDFEERPNVDISSLAITQNETYVSYQVTVEGKIRVDRNYTYYVCGYNRDDPELSDTFDFIIEYNNGMGSYRVWMEGDYVEKGNISSIDLKENSLNITMNRSRFVLGSTSESYIICAFTVLHVGEGKERFIDYVLTKNLKKDSELGMDDTTWMIAQIALIGFLIITTLILWNVWSKKKGLEQEGGVCPKCESRLDKNLDFCPHCGAFIRGPEVDKGAPKPKIVSPLDIEKEE
ncbi:MAG: hypothetical protein ACMUIE_06775 [Thermoplasmatota archaeon]